MHRFVTEICTHVHISVTKRCIVEYETDALLDLCNRSISKTFSFKKLIYFFLHSCRRIETIMTQFSDACNTSQESFYIYIYIFAFCCVLLLFGTERYHPYHSGLFHWRPGKHTTVCWEVTSKDRDKFGARISNEYDVIIAKQNHAHSSWDIR